MTRSGLPSMNPLKRRNADSWRASNRVAREVRAFSNKEAIDSDIIVDSGAGRIDLLDILWVEHRNLPDAKDGLCILVQFNPIKTPVIGIRVDLEDSALIPTLLSSKFGIKIDSDKV